MQKDKNSVTKLVDAIERKGFVVRQQNLQDRRSNTIVLTEKVIGGFDTIMVPFYRYATWLFRLIARNVSAR